jgi:hypothetical protein
VTKIINYIDKQPMGKKARKVLLEAREARKGARKLARSGHPGRRAEGQKGVKDTTEFIHGVYTQDARERALA